MYNKNNIPSTKKQRKKVWKYFWQIFLFSFTLIQVYIYLRLNVFTSCVIPTYSMSPTLIEGDYIYVSLQKKDAQNRKESFKRNDILIFNFPYEDQENGMKADVEQLYCKRCAAIPGDTFYIDRQGVYHVKGTDSELGNRTGQIETGQLSVEYDSLYIPRIGDKLLIDLNNFHLYRACIEYETKKQIKIFRGKIYLGEQVIQSYLFKKNYYYMVGDNIGDSYDSRYWGLLPEELILGKGCFIWFSKNPETKETRWNRIFKSL